MCIMSLFPRMPVTHKAHVLQENVCIYRPCFDQCRFQTPICLEAVSKDKVVKVLSNLLPKNKSEVV